MTVLDRARIIDYVRRQMALFDGALSEYSNRLHDLVNALDQQISGQSEVQALGTQKARLTREHAEMTSDLAGLSAARHEQEALHSTLWDTFRRINEALDTGAYVQTGDTATWSFSAGDARFGDQGARAIPELAPQRVTGLRTGEMLLLHTTGRWAPSCSLSQVHLLNPETGRLLGVRADGGAPQPSVLTAGALTGPEGYTLEWTGSVYRARENRHSEREETQTIEGVRGDVCAVAALPSEHLGAAGKWFGLSAQGCVFAERSHIESTVDEESRTRGDNFSTSAAFSTGLRLPNTPFPSCPAGALLAFVLRAGTQEVLDVEVVQAPRTELLMRADADVYFVVNDRADCAVRDESVSLSVSVTRVRPVAQTAEATVQAMGAVLEMLAAQRSTLVAQGRILPSQRLELEARARVRLSEVLVAAGLPAEVAALPTPLLDLFNAFVTRAMVDLERAVEISAVQRRLRSIEAELAALLEEERLENRQGRLRALLPRWNLRALDGELVRDAATVTLEAVRDDLAPILELWYPRVLETPGVLEHFGALTTVPLDADLMELGTTTKAALTRLLQAYDSAEAHGHRLPGDERPVVVISYPLPDPADPFRVGSLSRWRTGPATQANELWSALLDGGEVTLSVTPELVYGRAGVTPGLLSCFEAVPVVQAMALYFVYSRETPDDWADRWVSGRAATTQTFATTAGPETYELSSPLWSSFEVDLLSGLSSSAVATLRNWAPDQRPLGLSPFGSFTFEFPGPVPAQLLENVSEVLLMFEVDSKRISSRLDWVGTCL